MQYRFSVFLIVAAALISVVTALGQTQSHTQRVERLSELTAQIVAPPAGHSSKSSNSFRRLAKERFELLRSMAEESPADVLRFALTEDTLARVPSSVKDLMEKRERAQGDLEVLAECEEHEGRTHHFLNTRGRRLRLYMDGGSDLLTGAKVEAEGVLIGDAFVVQADRLETTQHSAEAAGTTGDPALSGTTGEIKVLVLLVNFQNDTRQPYSVDQSNNIMFDPVNSASVTNYYREVSYGQTRVVGETRGWYTMSLSTTCDYTQIATKAKSAAQNAGVDLSAYTKLMYVFPAQNCGWSGLGYVGGKEAWINGSLTNNRTPTHELGHNLGLQHARFMDCEGVVVGTNCPSVEYGHTMDIMGSGKGHFHAYHKERLGWLNSQNMPPITTVTQSGSYFIAPYGTHGPEARALKILKSVDSSGRKTWYYIELRRNYGFDSGISSNSNLMNGVLVTLNQESNPQENYLLDMTPETTTRTDPALVVGRTYSDAGFSITPASVGDGGALINVTFGGVSEPTCILSSPTVGASPVATQWLPAGSSITYTVSVTNNNSSGCSNNSFNILPEVPGGWSVSVSTPIVNVAPGTTGSATVRLNAPTDAPDGPYSVRLSSTNSTSPTYSDSVTGSLEVYSSLGLNVFPSKATYIAGETVLITARVTANGTSVAGVSVMFTMTKPGKGKNRTVTATATTGPDGAATFTYRLNKKQDPAGIYLIRADTALNGVTAFGSTSFEVK